MSHIFISYSKQDMGLMCRWVVLTYQPMKQLEQILTQALNELGAQAVV